jgi:hypothetical protein
LGQSPSEFWGSTLREVWGCLIAFEDLEQQRQRDEWERTRWQTSWLLMMMEACVGSKKRVFGKLTAVPLPWDKEKADQVLTEEEKENWKAFIKRLDSRKKRK